MPSALTRDDLMTAIESVLSGQLTVDVLPSGTEVEWWPKLGPEGDLTYEVRVRCEGGGDDGSGLPFCWDKLSRDDRAALSRLGHALSRWTATMHGGPWPTEVP